VRFSPTSVWDETNPWNTALECVVADDEDVDFDVLFLSGTDWRRVIPEHERPAYPRPIVNLIQHVLHGEGRRAEVARLGNGGLLRLGDRPLLDAGRLVVLPEALHGNLEG